MGRNHARVFSNIEGVDLVAIVDPGQSPDLQNFNVPLVKSLSDLDYDSLDFAVIATPTSNHEQLSVELLRAGIPTLIEKPLASTALSAKNIVRAAAETRTLGAVGHIERFNPAIQQLKARIQAGDIGNVFQLATRRQGSFPNRVGDIGVVKDLASHDIDLTRWVLKSDYVSISAYSNHQSGRAHEDMVAVSAQLADGTIVNHVVNWLSPMKERVVVVTGEEGTFVANTLTGDLTLYKNGAFSVDWESFANFRGVTEGDVTRFAFPKKEPLISEIEGFIGAVRRIGNDIVTLEEGLEVVRVAELIVSSANEKKLNGSARNQTDNFGAGEDSGEGLV